MKPYYSDDSVTIYNGDCEEVIPKLGEIDLIVTSPPYNLRGSTGSEFARLKGGYGTHGDNMPHDEYVAWQRRVLTDCWLTLSNRGAIFYNHKPLPSVAHGLRLPLELVPKSIPIRQIITWDRGGGHIHVGTMFTPSYEWILLLAKPDFRIDFRGRRDLWRVFPTTGKNPEHPATFPLEIPKSCIEPTDARLVLDPFMGVGTTLQAARMLGRKAIGIEIEERFCEVAATRLSQPILSFD